MDPRLSREVPSCSDIDLSKIRRSSKISSWNSQQSPGWSLFASSRTRRNRAAKVTTFLQDHPFLTVTYYGACSPNISFWMAWFSFLCLALLDKYLITSCVPKLLKSHPSVDMLPIRLCKKNRLAIRHMTRQLFPKTLSTQS